MKAFRFMLVAATAMSAFAASATAAPPTVGTFTTTLTSDVIVSARQAGPNLIITEDQAIGTVSGALTGSTSFTYHGVVRADGSGQFQGRGTFTGTITGCGSMTVDFNFRFTLSANGDVQGTFATIAGSPVTYHGSLTGTVASATYTNTIHYTC
jgi:hypothetical protein